MTVAQNSSHSEQQRAESALDAAARDQGPAAGTLTELLLCPSENLQLRSCSTRAGSSHEQCVNQTLCSGFMTEGNSTHVSHQPLQPTVGSDDSVGNGQKQQSGPVMPSNAPAHNSTEHRLRQGISDSGGNSGGTCQQQADKTDRNTARDLPAALCPEAEPARRSGSCANDSDDSRKSGGSGRGGDSSGQQPVTYTPRLSPTTRTSSDSEEQAPAALPTRLPADTPRSAILAASHLQRCSRT